MEGKLKSREGNLPAWGPPVSLGLPGLPGHCWPGSPTDTGTKADAHEIGVGSRDVRVQAYLWCADQRMRPVVLEPAAHCPSRIGFSMEFFSVPC